MWKQERTSLDGLSGLSWQLQYVGRGKGKEGGKRKEERERSCNAHLELFLEIHICNSSRGGGELMPVLGDDGWFGAAGAALLS